MVQCELVRTPLESTRSDVVVVGLLEGMELSQQPLAKRIDRLLAGRIAEVVKLGIFRGKTKETQLLAANGKLQSPLVLLIGLGKPAEFALDTLREVAAKACLHARDQRLKTVALPLLAPKGSKISARAAARATAEGALLGLFEYREYKSEPAQGEEPRPSLAKILVVETAQRDAAAAGLQEGVALAECTNAARTLIMRPSIAKAPEAIARFVQAEARRHRVRCQVFAPAKLRQLGTGALLGVGSGSARPPRLVVLEYRGGKRRVLLCGKGITFDSGGINIKPSEGMERMKYDMAGSATVFAATLAAARLKLPVHLMAVMAMAENMPSGSAIRPGDVLRAYNGKTIEVANTDAEGRLVLADALSYGVARHKPDVAVDVATLTGAVRVALGGITTGIMGNDDGVIRGLIEAGKATGDDLWQLPLHKGYEKQVQSDIADVRNLGAAGMAGAIAGAAFLKQFVGDTKWAHLDIAGTCWTEKGPGDLQKDYLPKGPTGIGVRLLAEWMAGR